MYFTLHTHTHICMHACSLARTHTFAYMLICKSTETNVEPELVFMFHLCDICKHMPSAPSFLCVRVMSAFDLFNVYV